MTLQASTEDHAKLREPGGIAALIEQALACLEDGDHDQSIQFCEQALAKRKDSAEALYVLGLINLDLEDPVTGLKLIEAAHQLDSQVQEYAEMLAALYANLGNVNDSLFYAKLGTSLPKHPTISGLLPTRFGSFFYNLERGRSDLYHGHAERKVRAHDFSAAIRDCETQLELTPGAPETLRLLGECCRQTGELSRSIAAWQAVLHSEQALPEDFASLGDTLAAMGRSEAALSCHRMALEQGRDSAGLFSRLMAAQLSAPPAASGVIERLHEEWHRRFVQSTEPRPLSKNIDPSPERPLRIGYVSAEFFDNDMMTLIEPVLHTHNRDSFEIYCYSNGGRSDLITERIQRAANRWIDIDRVDDETVWQILRGDEIDITVDLTSHGRGCRALMMARRPSPITLSWLGYSHPPGVPQIDYFLADQQSAPERHGPFPTGEKTWHLESGLCAYLAPSLIPDTLPLPGLKSGHITYGAQCDLRLINPSTAALWARILRTIPAARLLVSNVLDLDLDSVERCLENFSLFGLRGQVDIVNASENFDTLFDFYHHIDIALDPPGVAATTETCRALWMGVPVLTRAGDRYAQRRGASLLSAAGFDQWIAEDDEMLITIGAELASNLEELSELRAGLRQRVSASNLGNPVLFTRNLEQAYRTMWRQWCAEQASAGSS